MLVLLPRETQFRWTLEAFSKASLYEFGSFRFCKPASCLSGFCQQMAALPSTPLALQAGTGELLHGKWATHVCGQHAH